MAKTRITKQAVLIGYISGITLIVIGVVMIVRKSLTVGYFKEAYDSGTTFMPDGLQLSGPGVVFVGLVALLLTYFIIRKVD